MSELILNEPATPPRAELHQLPPAPPYAPWGFWATTVWGVGAVVAMVAAEICVSVAVVEWRIAAGKAVPADLGSDAVAVSAVAFAILPVVFAVLWLAARVLRVSVMDYLAIRRVDAANLLIGLGCTLACLAVVDVVAHVSGRGVAAPFLQEIYRAGRESGMLPVVLVAILVAAPVTQELLFRGFLLRGWAASRLGAIGAVALTAAIYAVMHFQFDWITISQVFGLGLLFGWLRIRSGSIVTTILLHAGYSAAAVIQVAILAG